MTERKKLRTPIAVKLVVITTLLMVAAIVPITVTSSNHFQNVSKYREDDMNGNQANVIAKQVQSTIQSLIDKSKVVGGILYKNFPNEQDRQAALDLSFRSDHDLVSVEVITLQNGKPVTANRVINEDYLKQYDLKKDFIENLRNIKPFPLPVVFAGDVELRNSTVDGGAPLLTLGIPLVKDDTGNITNIVLADFRLDGLEKIFSSVSANERTVYLVDREGHILAHPDEKLALTGKKLDSLKIVHDAITTKAMNSKQQVFTDDDTGEEYAGAYSKTIYGVTVVAQVPMQVILEPSKQVKRQSFMISGMALSIALFLIVWFSLSLTRPLELLVGATNQVAEGNFEVRAPVQTKDEVGELASAFNHMIDGLKERDKVKSLFNKFHGTGIANKLITGEMKLGGEQREATVFFSDIRSFTSFSEKVSPQEVVNMLNEYFKIMVGIITKHNGVVDKFIGDAIMAVWGAPESFGNDAANAMVACLEMRIALANLNESRLARGLPEIRIGMGVHTGPLIAGTIGSDDRMEYTVIGDTVNMASRIEAATKAYGTDLLISEVTSEKIKDSFILEQAGTASVKGKSEPLKLFKVKGYVNESGETVMVETAYSSYEAGEVDKVKVA